MVFTRGDCRTVPWVLARACWHGSITVGSMPINLYSLRPMPFPTAAVLTWAVGLGRACAPHPGAPHLQAKVAGGSLQPIDSLIFALGSLSSFLASTINMFNFFLEGRGERENRRNINVREKRRSVASLMPSTGDLAHNPGASPDWERNQQLFGLGSALNPLGNTSEGRQQYFNLELFKKQYHHKKWLTVWEEKASEVIALYHLSWCVCVCVNQTVNWKGENIGEYILMDRDQASKQ